MNAGVHRTIETVRGSGVHHERIARIDLDDIRAEVREPRRLPGCPSVHGAKDTVSGRGEHDRARPRIDRKAHDYPTVETIVALEPAPPESRLLKIPSFPPARRFL